MARILSIDPISPQLAPLKEAVKSLWRGKLVAFPTETFYGLGANALDPDAVARIFRVKERSEDKPLPVFVTSIAMAESLARRIPAAARSLMERFWPGPLTLVLASAPHLPPALTARTRTVGLRIPSHPVALGLVRAAELPITASSANLSGAAPPTEAEMVTRTLGRRIDLVLDGGSTPGGPPSTILDCTVEPFRLLRPGALTVPEEFLR